MALYGEIFGHINIKKHYEDNKKMPKINILTNK
jgi:hypothetical protein